MVFKKAKIGPNRVKIGQTSAQMGQIGQNRPEMRLKNRQNRPKKMSIKGLNGPKSPK